MHGGPGKMDDRLRTYLEDLRRRDQDRADAFSERLEVLIEKIDAGTLIRSGNYGG